MEEELMEAANGNGFSSKDTATGLHLKDGPRLKESEGTRLLLWKDR